MWIFSKLLIMKPGQHWKQKKCSREAELTDEKLGPRECGDSVGNEIASLNPWVDCSRSRMGKPEIHLQNVTITLIVDRLKHLMTKIHILLDFW